MKPKMRFRKESLELATEIERVFEVFGPPMTVRQLYYQLVARGTIPNAQSAYLRLDRLSVRLREAEVLPWGWLIDRTREVQKVSAWEDLPDFLETVRVAYRKDLWQDNPDRVEIWLEKDALSGVFREVTDRYQAPLVVTRGYPSRSLLWESRRLIEEDGRPCFIYYFGDHDATGKDIERVVGEELSQSDTRIAFKRVAILPEDIDRFRLPPIPAKKTDTRYRRFVAAYGNRCVELDALPPDELRRRIDEVIQRHIDSEAWERLRNIERQEQESLGAVVQTIRNGRPP